MKSVEFYQRFGKIWVEFCRKDYSLEEFLKIPDAKILVNEMYHKIITDYLDLIKDHVKDIDRKGEVLGLFIKNYFLEKDKIYDVVVLGDGTIMKFNLEGKNNQNSL